MRTVLQHAWAEFEHDIRYKGTVPAEHVGEFDRRFTLAAGLLELADREFSDDPGTAPRRPPELTEATGDDDPRLDPRELAAYLAGQYSEAGWSRTEHYSWIAGLLLELGVTSLVELGAVLREADEVVIAARMDYRTRRAPSAGSTMPCSGFSGTGMSACTRTPTVRACSGTGSSG